MAGKDFNNEITGSQKTWLSYEKFIFRTFFIYFIIQAVPFLDWKFYRELTTISWTNFSYGDIFNLAHFTPRVFSGSDTYANWIAFFIVSVFGAFAWTRADRNKTSNYENLYYWLRVIVRYRLAIAFLAYGFIKLFPLQAPYPSISNLNTAYGDFNRWKLFSLSLGIVPGYESFLGLVEIVIGLLLLYRKTASIAAFIALIFTGNVFMSNIAYDGGEQVYSFYLISLAIFILIFDLHRIVHLLILQKPTAPNRFKPLFDLPWKKYGRIVLKTSFVLFFVAIYGFKVKSGYKKDPYQFPNQKGLPETAGVYNVSEFILNHDTLAYSKTDSVRWQDVVFEEWNTISIRSNRPVIIDSGNVDHVYLQNEKRSYELEGTGGRHYYSYESDPIHHQLILTNRNKHYNGEKIVLHYNIEGDEIKLSGINENSDSIQVTLNKLDKKYLLKEVEKQGRGKKIKL